LQPEFICYDTLINYIKSKEPAVIRVGWNLGGGHAYVVSGVQEAGGVKVNALYLIDPIGGHSSTYIGYAKLVNGVTMQSGTGRYTHTWSII